MAASPFRVKAAIVRSGGVRILGGVIDRDLALQLHHAGLVWRPVPGDSFQLLAVDMEQTGTDMFTVSDLTIEAHHFPTGTVLGFNGTTEWALDSVGLEDALWFPREDQLRTALGHTFERLERADADRWVVTTVFLGERATHVGTAADEAYALALLPQVLASS